MINKMSKFNILFVEDEKAIRDTYVEYLNMFFNEVYEASNGVEAYEIYKQKKPHIMIVDIHMPKMNGIELLSKIRETDHTTKAIMLTAHTDTILLLDASALKLTKYLVKPISRSELKEALELVIKELTSFSTLPLEKIDLKDNYSWDCKLQELTCDNQAIELTQKERKLFILLVSNMNKTFTREELMYEVWTNADEGSEDTLRQLIKGLRKKLPADTIKNIFGVGYKIEAALMQ